MIEALIETVRKRFDGMGDPRKGKNISHSFGDVCMAGYSVFHLQSPSFLAHQERLQKKFSSHNGATLFGFKEIPSDNQIRNVLDQVDPEDLKGLFEDLHAKVDLSSFKAEEGLMVALDGVYFFSSEKISCQCCLKRDHDGKVRHYHAMLVPALIHPEQKCALPMAPEFIQNADGTEKQDCELNSAKRWCASQKEWLSQNKVTLLGDDLFSRGPIVTQLMSYPNVRFIFVAKETSHSYLYQWIRGYEPVDIESYKTTETEGQKKRIYTYKVYHKVPLNGDLKSPEVTYFEMEVVDGKGKRIYFNTFVTNHQVTAKNIHKIAGMGRNRWRIENEAFNILKTKGYNLEHNFGHGKKHLSNVLACFNLLAFLIHHLSEVLCETYRKLRACYGARVRFFQDISFALSFQIFPSWDTFLLFILDISQPRKSSN